MLMCPFSRPPHKPKMSIKGFVKFALLAAHVLASIATPLEGVSRLIRIFIPFFAQVFSFT